MLKIAVCVKVIKGEINPFDACALECALQTDSSDITVVCMGAPTVETELLRLTRLGVKAVLLTDIRLAGSDTLVTANALSAVIRKIKPDIVFCGRQSIDGDTAQVGPCMSALLGYGLITNVMRINSADKTVECETRLGRENAALPTVLTVERINNLRFPKMRSQVGTVERINIDDIGLDASKCGLAASPTKVLKTFESKIGARKCSFITFDGLDAVIAEALEKRAETAESQTDGTKMKSITVIGEELVPKAREIAENIRVINECEPEKIAELVKNDNAVLWKADIWGRRTAPQVAAMLKTGLCADCTKLETDGERLLMYRPAFGGTLTAKIECRTRPQMATVRCADTENQSDVVLGIGRGAAEDLEKYTALAQKYNAEIGASRAVIDMNIFDYERQIGLTGKNISPKVYIACGISGAVQHTCAIERAQTIIAINPDKNARIFEFADYGIVGKL